jgi:hypothetical protein
VCARRDDGDPWCLTGENGTGRVEHHALDAASGHRAAPRSVRRDRHGGAERARARSVAIDEPGEHHR